MSLQNIIYPKKLQIVCLNQWNPPFSNFAILKPSIFIVPWLILYCRFSRLNTIPLEIWSFWNDTSMYPLRWRKNEDLISFHFSWSHTISIVIKCNKKNEKWKFKRLQVWKHCGDDTCKVQIGNVYPLPFIS